MSRIGPIGIQRAIALGIFDEAKLTEEIVLAVGVRGPGLNEPGDGDQRRRAIRGHLQAAGYTVDEIVTVDKIGLPRTAGGKVRRQECRELKPRQELGVG